MYGEAGMTTWSKVDGAMEDYFLYLEGDIKYIIDR